MPHDQPDRLAVADDCLFLDDPQPEQATGEMRPAPPTAAIASPPGVAMAAEKPTCTAVSGEGVGREPARPTVVAATSLDDPEEDDLDELEPVSDAEIPSGAPLTDATFSIGPETDWLADDLPEPDDADDAGAFDDVDFGLDLEEYDRPSSNAEPVEPDWRIDRRAAEIIRLLPEAGYATGEAALGELIRLLEEFPHGSSHAAIQRLAENGASLQDLTRIAELKRFWSDDCGLWLRRRFDPMARDWQAFQTGALRHAMTWRLARQLLEEREPLEVQDLLSGAWLNEWLALSSDVAFMDAVDRAGFYTFPLFVAQRAELIVLKDDARWPYEHAADDSCRRTFSSARWQAHGLLVPDRPSPWSDRGVLSRLPLSQRVLEEQ